MRRLQPTTRKKPKGIFAAYPYLSNNIISRSDNRKNPKKPELGEKSKNKINNKIPIKPIRRRPDPMKVDEGLSEAIRNHIDDVKYFRQQQRRHNVDLTTLRYGFFIGGRGFKCIAKPFKICYFDCLLLKENFQNTPTRI